MESLENQLEKHETIIRKYLLDRLDSETAREIDEKIITEPDFFNLVALLEAEIVDDLTAGRLVGDEKLRAEKIYGLPVNQDKLNFSRALYKVAGRNRLENQAKDSDEIRPVTFLPQTGIYLKRFKWRRLIPALAGFVVVVSLVLWYFFPGKRTAMERELARINRENTIQIEGKKVQPLSLPPDTMRAAAPMSKIAVSSDDTVIGFRLGIINIDAESGIATFQDDNGTELFAVSGMKLQSDENGRYVNVFVPARFLPSGDYQIDLQTQQPDKTLAQAGSYTFRVIRE